jgi:ABC-2 type transport system permease protein
MIINGENMKLIDQFMEAFPEEILKTFNMDLASLDSAYGWLKTEGFVFLSLILGCYSAILGSNILLKEENDKTIEYLNSLPITRNEIVLKKSIVGISYIVLMVLIFGVVNYTGLTLSGTFDIKQFILMSITPIFSSITIFFACLFLSTYTHKTKKMIGISLGIVLISYILQTLSTLAKETAFFQYFSVFTLADLRNVILNIKINPLMIILTILISGLFLILT